MSSTKSVEIKLYINPSRIDGGAALVDVDTVDTVTGDRVLTFGLTIPSGDVTIASGEIGILGLTVYP